MVRRGGFGPVAPASGGALAPKLAALPTQTPRRTGIRRRGRRAIRRACGSAPHVLSDKSFHRRSVQATCLAVCGGARWTWRRHVGDHGLFSPTRAPQTARASRSASGARRPMPARRRRFFGGRFRRRVWRSAGALGARGVVKSGSMGFSRRRGRCRPPGRRVRPPELPGRCQHFSASQVPPGRCWL